VPSSSCYANRRPFCTPHSEVTTNDPFLPYLSRYFTGRAKQASGDRASAVAAYRGALEIVPRAESASLALAALSSTGDARDEAYAVVEAALSGEGPAADPWRLYQTGDFRFWQPFIGCCARGSHERAPGERDWVHPPSGAVRISSGGATIAIPISTPFVTRPTVQADSCIAPGRSGCKRSVHSRRYSTTSARITCCATRQRESGLRAAPDRGEDRTARPVQRPRTHGVLRRIIGGGPSADTQLYGINATRSRWQ
jgi:hypothetical protein